jgi:uncharacterized repeat protein (TIGR03987 family)
MTPKLTFAIITMILALSCYSIGVWSEKLTGRLKPWHVVFFWIGLIFDTTGTTIMAEMAGGMQFNLHGVTGSLAIILMFSHAIWATVVLWLKQEKAIRSFHNFSLAVWGIWLIPFVGGIIGAMVG